MVQIIIEIPDEDYEELRAMADFDGIPLKTLIAENIVVLKIARDAWRNPRKKLAVTDENFEPITEIAPPERT